MTALQDQADALRELRRRCRITTFLALAILIAYIVGEFDPSVPDDWSLPPINPPDVARQPYHYLTYALVHSGWMHVGANALSLLLSGFAIECNHRGRVVVTLFTAGVIGAGLNYHGRIYLLGASGGTSALAGAAITNGFCWILHRLYSYFRTTRTAAADAGQIGQIAIPFMQLLVGLLVIVPTHMFGGAKTAHSAHTGGLVVGAIGGLLMLVPIFQRRRSLYDLITKPYYEPVAFQWPETVHELEMAVLDLH